ncbi:hypothetical protein LHYA1_G006974 [Lachnellula hyalina]|uniref:BTB domain-containing protein n=1 Tax=Lachnellula hyalina TaxID=1316788 RepID=A0A8H8TYN7_9HELO|nr:uncharacterized protein LHYA1_G006974 [Lachnellula hyalina]TVY24086.1 hypothetical protein LHYA1_G006974 [Lachnellula hyalina]
MSESGLISYHDLSRGTYVHSRPAAPPAAPTGWPGSSPPSPIPAKIEKKTKAPNPSFRNPTELITVEFGPEKIRFVVHKEFACYHSPVLKAALNSNFIEGQTQTYTLRDPRETTGRVFVHWLYSQQLLDYNDWEPKSSQDKHLILIQLHMLADKLLIPRLQNAIIQLMHQHIREHKLVLRRTLKYVYKETETGSLLRRFILHLCACYMPRMVYSEFPDDVPKEMLLELALEYQTSFRVGETEKAFGMVTNWSQYQVLEK